MSNFSSVTNNILFVFSKSFPSKVSVFITVLNQMVLSVDKIGRMRRGFTG
jgi:hypothetical protein